MSIKLTFSVGRRTALKSLKYLSSSAAAEVREKWDLYSSICLERKPIITQELSDIESRFAAVTRDLEYELSLKSDHELRHEKDMQRQARMKKNDTGGREGGVGSLSTAQDFEDAAVEELSRFKFAERITEADVKKDQKTIERMLDKHLLLVVKQKLGKTTPWTLPLGVRKEGETMRQAAERVLNEACGKDLKARFMSNAPCGFYKFKYPKELREKEGLGIGGKVFFFKAHLLSERSVQKGSGVEDYLWLGRQELEQVFDNKYHKLISSFLIDEN